MTFLRQVLSILSLILPILVAVVVSTPALDRDARAADAGVLIVKIDGFEHERGQLLLSIFDTEAGFQADSNKAIRTVAGTISNRSATVVIEGLPPFTYAIARRARRERQRQAGLELVGDSQ